MIYILLLIVFFILELLYFRIADKYNIIDKPNERSSHTRITLRGGGVIFFIAFFVYFLLNGFPYPFFTLGLMLIALISFADDIRPQSSKIRLIVHFVAMAMMFYDLGLFSMPWYFLLTAVVFCTGILNAYNFMDGINGITGMYSIVVLGSLWYINTSVVRFIDNEMIIYLLLSLLVFNFFNCRIKAKCFAGDVGAISIAFVIVFLLIKLVLLTDQLTYIILLAIYGVDTILTIIHRIILHENILEPHRKHFYQLMANELRMRHLLVSFIYAALQLLISAGLIFFDFSIYYSIISVLILCTIYILLKIKYFHLHTNTND